MSKTFFTPTSRNRLFREIQDAVVPRRVNVALLIQFDR